MMLSNFKNHTVVQLVLLIDYARLQYYRFGLRVTSIKYKKGKLTQPTSTPRRLKSCNFQPVHPPHGCRGPA